jgi:predicted sulfurtransferase
LFQKKIELKQPAGRCIVKKMPNKKISHIIIALILIASLSACAPKVPQTEDAVPRVKVEDAKLALDNGKAVIVDVRSAEFYAEGHAVGAISIPLDEFENNIENLPLDKDQWIITYCT